MDHNFSFNSPATGGAAPSRLAKPRFTKKKFTAANRPVDSPNFNPFRPVENNLGPSDCNAAVYPKVGFEFGASRASSSGNLFSSSFGCNALGSVGIVEADQGLAGQIRELRIESEQQHVNLDASLPEEVENKLKIQSEGNIDSSQKGDNSKCKFSAAVENVDGIEGVKIEMNKLNIKDGASEKLRSPAFGGVESLGRNSDNELYDRLKNLHLKETADHNLRSDNVNIDASSSGNSTFIFGVDRNRVVQPDETKNSQYGGLSDQMQADSRATSGLGAPFIDTPGKKVEFGFSGSMQNVEFKTPDLKGSFNRKFETKRDPTKDTRSKKKKGKPRKPFSIPMNVGQGYFPAECLQENVDTYESYSPMDISPYEETLAENTSRETSVTSDEALNLNDDFASSELHPMVSNDIADEELIDATHHLSIDENNVNYNENEKVEPLHSHPGVSVEGPSEDYISGAETESFISATDQLDCGTDSFVTAADNELTSSSTVEGRDVGGGDINLEDTCQSNFIFAASSTQCHSLSSSVTRHQKKKNQTRLGSNISNSIPTAKVPYSSFSLNSFQVSPSPLNKNKNVDMPTISSQSQDRIEPIKEKEVKLEARSTLAESMAAQEACEKWRLRGNQAYASGDLSRAEDYYTQGVNCISQSETSKIALQAMMLCYSNRAATRMSLGKMKGALEDCLMAIKLDPNFLKVQVRAANCYLSLGDTENASRGFMRCLEMGNKSCVERKVLLEASEGLEKAQKVSGCIEQSEILLGRRTSDDAVCALAVIADALMISPCSEKLLEMKAGALLMLRKYEDVIQLCELTLASVELTSQPDVDLEMFDGSKMPKTDSFRLWCCSLAVKAYFYLGKLDEAVNFLNKLKSTPLMGSGGTFNLESSIPLAATIRELLRLKAAGNEAFQSGKHAEAIEHYSAAISCNVESRPFAAICFCNRAAAYRASGQILDAIADCSLSIALDGNYAKATSRRASLLEMIRDYGQAAADLRRLIALLTRQMENKINQSDKSSFINEIRQTQQKLMTMEEEDRKEMPLNMYLILGVDPSAASSEIRKAYRKAALKHHPDKAGQSLAKNDNSDDGIWREIAEEVRRDADRLFKMIGEAYALLSDPSKRARYDLEEEMRNSQNRGNRSSTTKTHMDSHNYQSDWTGSRWRRSDIWRGVYPRR